MIDFISILLFVFPALVIIAGVNDLMTMKIPNWINLSIFFSFYPVALIIGLDWVTIGLSSVIGLGVLFAGMIMFALRWIGGGDAKLFAAASLWMGPDGALAFILLSAIVGGLFCIVLMQARAWFQVIVPSLPAWGQRLMEPKGDIPYGVAITAGGLWAFTMSNLIDKFTLM